MKEFIEIYIGYNLDPSCHQRNGKIVFFSFKAIKFTTNRVDGSKKNEENPYLHFIEN